jgi:hypothetical protein
MDDVLVEDQGGAGDAWRGETHVLAKAQRRTGACIRFWTVSAIDLLPA